VSGNSWKHKNRIVFHNGVTDDIEILVMTQMKTWLWAKYRRQGFNYSYSDWSLYPIGCLATIK